MAKLADFLEKLSSDEAFEAEFDADPDGLMDRFKLSDEHKRLVRKGTAKEIREAVRKEEPNKKIVVFRVKMG
jgi:hypothetical protein